ncbi:hypothetical protein B0H12DRAFT_476775 [Mycena haematopus]|nr:hypothetical protein B0H12DRAFT_476775 [Mycena haematopus]
MSESLHRRRRRRKERDIASRDPRPHIYIDHECYASRPRKRETAAVAQPSASRKYLNPPLVVSGPHTDADADADDYRAIADRETKVKQEDSDETEDTVRVLLTAKDG